MLQTNYEGGASKEAGSSPVSSKDVRSGLASCHPDNSDLFLVAGWLFFGDCECPQ